MTFSLPTASTDRIKRTDDPAIQAELLRQGWVQDDEPAFDSATQHPPVRENRAWVVRDKTPEELAEKAKIAARKIWKTTQEFISNIVSVAPEALPAIGLSQDPAIAALRIILYTWHGEVWSDDQRVQQAWVSLKAASILTQEQIDLICTKE